MEQSDVEQSSKMELLKEYLGNLSEYTSTGWSYNIYTSTWIYERKRSRGLDIEELKKREDFPVFIDKCHCSTRIIINCLIINLKTQRLEFVGSVCNKHIGGNVIKCIDCYQRHRCDTNRCANCRRKCYIHDTYHEDNSVHNPEPIIEHKPEPIISSMITFGKYQYQEFIWIKENDLQYYNWLKRTVDRNKIEWIYKHDMS
jgi:hypothetical protein